ncbi:MAG: nicotinamide riboside transporter PnuC [Halioglobus sp.]|nr:nicotinamide riboside transporter PnuC [Halioglobus sp.]
MAGEVSSITIVEIVATVANLLYIIFLIKEKIVCWSFGIAGSLLSIYLFVETRLYSEAVLYGLYVGLGCWGWLRWHQRLEIDNNPIIQWPLQFHWWALLLGSIISLGLGYAVHTYSDAERPLLDAFTTIFSLLATYLEITKVLETWIYWLILNVVTMWLYHDRALDIYAVLIGCYSILSVWGFLKWRRAYRLQSSISR